MYHVANNLGERMLENEATMEESKNEGRVVVVVVVMTLLVLNPLIKLCLKLATPKVHLRESIVSLFT